MTYNFTEWVKGSLNEAPNSLSRCPVSDPQTQDMLAECDPDDNVEASIAEIHAISSGEQESFHLQDLQRRTMFTNNYHTISLKVFQTSGVSCPMSARHFGGFGVSYPWTMV